MTQFEESFVSVRDSGDSGRALFKEYALESLVGLYSVDVGT